jgi:hypothetical protein
MMKMPYVCLECRDSSEKPWGSGRGTLHKMITHEQAAEDRTGVSIKKLKYDKRFTNHY